MNSFLRKCNDDGKATCNTAVAILSGDDVVVIDAGGTKKGHAAKRLRLFVYVNGQLTPGTRVMKFLGGKKFIVSRSRKSIPNKNPT